MSDPTRRTLVEIEADLDASDAEADAGEFVPAQIVHAKLKAALERFQHQPSSSKSRKTSSNRGRASNFANGHSSIISG